MQHIAIMKKEWGLLPKIITGQKTIESRWYMHRAAPWGRIKVGDTVYFKDSGQPVMLRASADFVLQFADLTPEKVAEILAAYGQADGLTKTDIPIFYERFKNKRYCLLIFLKDVQAVEPFAINKQGYGAMSAWLTTESVDNLRLK